MLMQFDPFREIDRLAEQPAARGGRGCPRWTPTAAVTNSSSRLTCRAPGAIDLTVEQNVLTI